MANVKNAAIREIIIDAALHILVSLYVFAAMISITELEMGKNNDF